MGNKNNNDFEQRLSQLHGMGKEDTVANLLNALRDAKIKSAQANTSEAMANSILQLEEITRKLTHKTLQPTCSLKEKIAIAPETKNALALIKELHERNAYLELSERKRKLSGLPEKSTNQALLDLKETKNKVRNYNSISELKNSLDDFKVALQVVLDKMYVSTGKEKEHLYSEVYSASLFLHTYTEILSEATKTPEPKKKAAATDHKKIKSEAQSQTPQHPKQGANYAQGVFFTAPAKKEPARTQQKNGQINSLYKQLGDAKLDAAQARNKAKDAVKKYNDHKTPSKRRVALASIKLAKANKRLVDFLQEQIKKNETAYTMAAQLKDNLHHYKQKKKPDVNDELEKRNNRYRP